MAAWDEPTIVALLDKLRMLRGDTTNIKIKKAAGGLPANLPETICAFANMPAGGTVILGIDERGSFTVSDISSPAEIMSGLVALLTMGYPRRPSSIPVSSSPPFSGDQSHSATSRHVQPQMTQDSLVLSPNTAKLSVTASDLNAAAQSPKEFLTIPLTI